ncbi:transposase [Roseateles sp. DC23W]|uniref:Transposase n=1 Tax=Pelomonas dachongensis TaxID=3299029 RepID=A0ABW7EV34_9BURK
MSQVRIVGIDETSLRRGQDYVTVVRDLDAKRLLFCTEGRDHLTVQAFAQDRHDHGGEPTEIAHACMDMSAAYRKGATAYLPNAQVSYHRFPGTGLDVFILLSINNVCPIDVLE